jgi:intraflagellar transport protein 172
VVHLFDDTGVKKDKFQTKPSEKLQKSYLIRAIEFSPDSEKIAVAQSDNIVYVYKIGKEWNERKSICNKFPMPSPVTCLVWPKDRANEIVFGLAEGKVRAGVLKVNKSNVLYQTDVYVVSIACSRDGETIISGHIDGTIHSYQLDSQVTRKVCTHHSIPYALAYG